MNRRDAILYGLALAASLPTRSFAQQPAKTWRVGALYGGSEQIATPYAAAFIEEMKKHGYVVGQNLILDSRFAAGDSERYAPLAHELIALRPDVLIAANTAVAIELKMRTTTIPIVLATAADPVGSGLVKSLARPGGNVTGVSVQLSELIDKQIELLGEVLPRMKTVALLLDASNVPAAKLSNGYEQSAKAMAAAKGLSAQFHRVGGADGIHQVFGRIGARRPDALVIAPAPIFNSFRKEICQQALDLRLPTIAFVDDYARDGALLSYGPSFVDSFRRVADFVNRILKGAKPDALPIEQPTKFSLVINAKTAQAIGVTIPRVILLRAEHVIE